MRRFFLTLASAIALAYMAGTVAENTVKQSRTAQIERAEYIDQI